MTYKKNLCKMNKRLKKRLKYLEKTHGVYRSFKFECSQLAILDESVLGLRFPSGRSYLNHVISFSPKNKYEGDVELHIGTEILHFPSDEIWKLELWLLRRYQLACKLGYRRALSQVSALYALLVSWGFVLDIDSV